jgi:hypothetical protein
LTGKDFQRLFLEAVDDAFSSLGDSAKQSIYFYLETRFKVPRDQIPNRLEDFETGLEKIFGAGTRFLEILIMKKLYEKTEHKRRTMKWNEDKEFKFIEYVKATEQTFYKKKKKL